METKKCYRCKQDLPYSAFTKRSTNADGYDSYCRSCKAQKHQEYRHGKMNLEASDVRRFMEKVKLAENGCWEWTGSVNWAGYGHFDFHSIRSAHRFSYYIFKGELSEGMEVCHSCDNPKCVNPAHLWLGTRSENIRDAAIKGRTNTVRLSPADVRTIRELHDSGAPTDDIAQRYGMSKDTVQDIVSRRTWDHIADDATEDDAE